MFRIAYLVSSAKNIEGCLQIKQKVWMMKKLGDDRHTNRPIVLPKRYTGKWRGTCRSQRSK